MKPVVLIIDDEPDVLRLLERSLEDEYEIRSTTSPAQALEMLDDNIQVILSDQCMPHMNGSEFLIKARQKCPRAVRLLMSAYSDMGAMINAINEAEIFRYISKPWELEDLRDTMGEAVAKYHEVGTQ